MPLTSRHWNLIRKSSAPHERPLGHARRDHLHRAPASASSIRNRRGFFAATTNSFDIIEFSPVGSLGLAGSNATQESYLYTVESVRAHVPSISPPAGFSPSPEASAPLPRGEELRAFNLAAQIFLRQENIDPATHLAMIRNFSFSCTILVFNQAISPTQSDALRLLQKMSFDI